MFLRIFLYTCLIIYDNGKYYQSTLKISCTIPTQYRLLTRILLRSFVVW